TWAGLSSLEKGDTKEKSTFFDVEDSKRATPIVTPIDEQGDLESRRLWNYGDIEQKQRDKVKNGIKSDLQYFEWHDDDQLFLSLEKLIDNKYHLDDKYREKG
ncbi:19880_t:CDS:2, partial [Entrophospora sp. SA101]